MFILLLIINLLVAVAVATSVARFFAVPIRTILSNIIVDDISYAWSRYIWFAILVVGISSGVRIWELERYITPMDPVRAGTLEPAATPVLVLTRDRWILELYRTIIGSLQGIAWLLLVFFVFALIAYVIVRVGENRARKA